MWSPALYEPRLALLFLTQLAQCGHSHEKTTMASRWKESWSIDSKKRLDWWSKHKGLQTFHCSLAEMKDSEALG